MPLTIVRKYPGILNEEERGPELPSPRSAAPRSGAVLRLREKLGSRPRPRQSPPISQGLSRLASRVRSLTLGASWDVLEGQRELTTAGKVVG